MELEKPLTLRIPINPQSLQIEMFKTYRILYVCYIGNTVVLSHEFHAQINGNETVFVFLIVVLLR